MVADASVWLSTTQPERASALVCDHVSVVQKCVAPSSVMHVDAGTDVSSAMRGMLAARCATAPATRQSGCLCPSTPAGGRERPAIGAALWAYFPCCLLRQATLADPIRKEYYQPEEEPEQKALPGRLRQGTHQVGTQERPDGWQDREQGDLKRPDEVYLFIPQHQDPDAHDAEG